MVENKPESQIHLPGSTWEQLIQCQPPRQPQQRYRSLAPRFTRGAQRGLRAAGAGQPPRAQLFTLAAPRSSASAHFSYQHPLNAVLVRWRPGSFQSTVLPRCMATNSQRNRRPPPPRSKVQRRFRARAPPGWVLPPQRHRCAGTQDPKASTGWQGVLGSDVPPTGTASAKTAREAGLFPPRPTPQPRQRPGVGGLKINKSSRLCYEKSSGLTSPGTKRRRLPRRGVTQAEG